MIVTFDDLLCNWVTQVNISSARKKCHMLNIGSYDPLFYSLNKDSNQCTYLWGREVGNAVILLAHGNENEINTLDANRFCDLYRQIPNIQNKPLILISCDSGKPRGPHNVSLAQERANVLRNENVTVYAPNGSSIFCEYALAIVNPRAEYIVYLLQQSRIDYFVRHNLPVPEWIGESCINELITHLLNNPAYGNVKMFNEIPDQITDYTILGLTRFTGQ